MAEEFQAGICEGAWWNTSRSVLAVGSSPCSLGVSDMGSYGWGNDMGDMKTRPGEESTNSLSDSSIVFQNTQKAQQTDSDSGGSSVLLDSTLQMMGFGLSSTPSSDWNQGLIHGSGRGDSNYGSMLQEDMNLRLSYGQERGTDSSQIQKEWSPKSFTSTGENYSITTLKHINQDFSLEQQSLNSVSSSGNPTATCQAGFPINSASYGYPSTLIQTLFEPDHPQQQQSLLTNRSMNLMPMENCGTCPHEISASWPNKLGSFLKPSLLKQQPNSLHFSNNTPFWNASATCLNGIKTSLPPPLQSQYLPSTFEEKPNCPDLITKPNIEDFRDSASVVKKGTNEPSFKRPRIETPSPLPTFKVRKEKLGDRVTALQQLVSPFGKTDTASVLHEAIDYIKFLHDQVSVLSTPYMKNGAPIQHQQSPETMKDPEGPKQDLRSRGLCLVPISSTFPVANETTADFWTPTFGGTFR
ncbi:hypothetical protein CFOL_v3_33380 [Cephalotus follicularis]|uniref:BHLH domain-containing protein n=1 Tax=Cephalotus follicularis TaxID=3775 RepID=A0A1Q3DC28_CEPFO|nr:hypothetical protein CFOL_v3_33380 [Cephalotus follicularis]